MNRVKKEILEQLVHEIRMRLTGSVLAGKAIVLVHDSKGLSLNWYTSGEVLTLLKGDTKRDMYMLMMAYIAGIEKGKWSAEREAREREVALSANYAKVIDELKGVVK